MRKFLLAVLAICACKDDPKPEGYTTSRIGPNGGTITSEDNVLSIAIHPGALREEFDFFIEPSDIPPPVFGSIYRVTPTPLLDFPASISYRSELPANVDSIALVRVDPDAYDIGEARWIIMETVRIDAEKRVVGAIDSRISAFYGLLGTDEAMPTGGTGDGATGGTAGETGDIGDDDDDDDDDDDNGDDDDDDNGDDDDDDNGDDDDDAAPSFAEDVQPILNAGCGCHTDGGNPAGLALDDGYDNLVGAAATQAGLDRVTAGSLDDSYLWLKLNDQHARAGEGDPMPLGGYPLADGLDVIQAWIEGGANP